MARYFMHLVDGEDVLLNPEGVEASEDAMKEMALKWARDCLAGDARNGVIDFSYRIEVHDAAETLVHSLPFAEAVAIKWQAEARV